MSDLSTPTCPRCSSQRVATGSLDPGSNHPAFMLSDRRRGFVATLSLVGIPLSQDAWLCASCGLCWSTVPDLAEALEKIRIHGSERLVGRVLPDTEGNSELPKVQT